MVNIRTAVLGVIVAGSLFAVPLLAQNMGGTSNATIGVMGGVNYGKASQDPEEPGTSLDYLTGWLAGVFAGWQVNRNVSVEAQGLYSLKGTELNASDFTAKIKAKYIELHGLAKWWFPNTSTATPYIFAGPVVEFKTGCTLEGSSGGISISEDCDQEDIDLKSTSFAGTAGVGVEFKASSVVIRFDGRYTYGFTNINDNANDNTKAKLRTFQFTGGIGIPLP